MGALCAVDLANIAAGVGKSIGKPAEVAYSLLNTKDKDEKKR